jgi:lambda repressor-like predicted transcriptional regulator
MTPMERVEAEVRARGESLASFAARIGVRSQDINNWKKRGIPRSRQRLVADALGWTLDRLLAENGVDSVPPAQRPLPAAGETPADSPGHFAGVAEGGGARVWDRPASVLGGGGLWIPRRRIVMQGGHVSVVPEEGGALAFARAWVARSGLREESTAVYCAQDDSMHPAIRAGDLLLVDVADQELADARVFLVCYRGELKARRVYLGYDGAWILRADNREGGYPDQSVPADDQGTRVILVGRVLWRAGIMGP